MARGAACASSCATTHAAVHRGAAPLARRLEGRPQTPRPCDRARSITWGIEGGLPSLPHGVWLDPGSERERFLGAVFSNVPIVAGDMFTRPSAGGGGYGDPLDRDPDRVCEDVADGYVSVERALKDYGVVVREVDADLAEYEVDTGARPPRRARAWRRRILGWLGAGAKRRTFSCGPCGLLQGWRGALYRGCGRDPLLEEGVGGGDGEGNLCFRRGDTGDGGHLVEDLFEGEVFATQNVAAAGLSDFERSDVGSRDFCDVYEIEASSTYAGNL